MIRAITIDREARSRPPAGCDVIDAAYHCWGCGNAVAPPRRQDDTTECCDYDYWAGDRDEEIIAPLQTEDAT